MHVTATVVCANDPTHTITDEGTVTFATIKAATCEEAGEVMYVATFTKAPFTVQIKKVAIEALGHAYGEPTFEWTETETGYTVKATAICANDAAHKLTVDATVEAVTTAATCEAAGKTVYTATAVIDGKTYTDTKEVEIPALGHKWTFVDFTWTETETGYTAVANFKCENDATHEMHVDAIVSAETTEATCEADGKTVYTATAPFEGSYVTGTKEVTIQKLGHKWGDPIFSWIETEDGYDVEVNMVCLNDATHVYHETVHAVYSIVTAPTEETPGVGRYTATFSNEAIEPQTKDVVIPPVGHEDVTVTFNTDGGSAVDPQTVPYGKTIVKPADPTKEGYDFTGWTLNGEAFDFTTPITADITLVATWTVKTFTVKFNSNGGTAVESQTVEYGKTAAKPEDPTKEGFDFAGWTLDGEAYDFSTPVKGDITLVATWTVKTFRVTFDPDNGEEPTVVEVEYNKTVMKPLDPTKEAYVFLGWFAEGADEAFDFETPIMADLTLKAHWKPAPEPTKVVLDPRDVEYKGSTPYVIYDKEAQTPRFTVQDMNGTVIDPSLYDFSYDDNVLAGTGYIDIHFKTDKYEDCYGWFKIYLPASEWLTVENVENGIKLEWAPVEDAAGYVIYRRAWNLVDSGWTTFERWNNTTDTTWIDTEVYAGTRYQYGVKAYFAERTNRYDKKIGDRFDNYNLGIVSPLKTTVRITTRTIKSVTPGTRSLTVKWSGSKVFSGYRLEYSTTEDFSSNVRAVKIADKATYQYTIKGLETGKTYYVRICSYHDFEDMVYFGQWSNVMSGKVN